VRQEPDQTHELHVIIPFTPEPPPDGEGTDAEAYALREGKPLLVVPQVVAEAVTDLLETVRAESRQTRAIGRPLLAIAQHESRAGRQMIVVERAAFVAGVLAALDQCAGVADGMGLGVDEDVWQRAVAERAGLTLDEWRALDDDERAIALMRYVEIKWTGVVWNTTHADGQRNREVLASRPKPWNQKTVVRPEGLGERFEA